MLSDMHGRSVILPGADDHAIVPNGVAQIYPRACWHSATAAHRFAPDPHPASP